MCRIDNINTNTFISYDDNIVIRAQNFQCSYEPFKSSILIFVVPVTSSCIKSLLKSESLCL